MLYREITAALNNTLKDTSQEATILDCYIEKCHLNAPSLISQNKSKDQ